MHVRGVDNMDDTSEIKAFMRDLYGCYVPKIDMGVNKS